MAEGLDPHTQEVMDENQKLRDQHQIASERLQEAEAITARERRSLKYFQDQDFRNQGTPMTAAAERGVYRAEGLVEKENERLETHLKMAGMAAAENLDVLSEQAKKEMEEDLASRDNEKPETSSQ